MVCFGTIFLDLQVLRIKLLYLGRIYSLIWLSQIRNHTPVLIITSSIYSSYMSLPGCSSGAYIPGSLNTTPPPLCPSIFSLLAT